MKRLLLVLCGIFILGVVAYSQTNQPPVAFAGQDRTVYTNVALRLLGGATDPEGDLIVQWFWVVFSAPPSATWDLTDWDTSAALFQAYVPGDYVIGLSVADSHNYSLWDFVTVHVVDNIPPVAVVIANKTDVLPQDPVCFDASQSSDPEGGPLTYYWDFGDGASDNKVAPCHAFKNQGTYDVEVTVIDELNACDHAQITITVNPNPSIPTAVLTADKIWGEGSFDVCLDASQSSDPEGYPLTFTWQIFSEGYPPGVIYCCTPTKCYTFDWEGVVTVQVTVTDVQGYSAQASIRIYSGVNAPPVANAGLDQSVHVGAMVTLDGSGSSDPNDTYPLEYTWFITDRPAGSEATLSDAKVVSPSFIADKEGTYVCSLIVKDSEGMEGTPDNVWVSTLNVPPVADAGADQAVTRVGTTVNLDGTQSYDLDGDSIIYSWTMTSKPANSQADINNPSFTTPNFTADIKGDYVVSLTVRDRWASGEPDEVIVTFANVKPVADAGGNQSVLVGTQVTLNGSGSTDANDDPLAYSWSMVTQPEGSTAAIQNSNSVNASFVPDVPGTYVVSLVVNDGTEDSDPSNVSVVAITQQSAVTDQLMQTIDVVNSLNPAVFKNENLVNALTNKLNEALTMVQNGQYAEALDKLQNDILQKTNGCAEAGKPDKNDWIEDCTSQALVYVEVMEAITLLSGLTGG